MKSANEYFVELVAVYYNKCCFDMGIAIKAATIATLYVKGEDNGIR